MPASSVTTVERPRYPRSPPDTEETTDTSIEYTPAAPDPDIAELTQPLPLVTDTEPGEPPAVPDDELPWVHEPAVEPTGAAAATRKRGVPIEAPITMERVIDDEEPLTAVDLPLPGQEPGIPGPAQPPSGPRPRRGTQPDRPTPHSPDSGSTQLSEPTVSVSDYAPTRPGTSPPGSASERDLPAGPRPRSRPSRPPAPIDSSAFEATLRSAGASEDDVAAMLAALASDREDD